jgi:hypothetical protein
MVKKKEYRTVMLTVGDLVRGFLDEDRLDDEDLPRGRIEELVEENPDLIDDICAQFRDTLMTELDYEDSASEEDEEEEDEDDEEEDEDT